MRNTKLMSIPPGMTPLMQEAFDLASYKAPVRPNELRVRLSYILGGGLLSLCLLIMGVILVYTNTVLNSDMRLLIASATLLGFFGLCSAFVAAITVLCRAYTGVYTKNVTALGDSMDDTQNARILIEAFESLRADPEFGSFVATAARASSPPITLGLTIIKWIEMRIQEKQPAIRRLFHNAA